MGKLPLIGPMTNEINFQIENLKSMVKGVSFVHIFCEANFVVDSIAKAKISRSSDFVA